MSEEIARTILYAIAGAGAAFWMFTAVSFASMVRGARSSEPIMPRGGSFKGIEGRTGDDLLTGQSEVNGKPIDLAARLAESLGRAGLGGLLVRVLEKTDERVVFEVTNQGPQGVPQGMGSRRGEAVFRSSGGGRTRVEFAIEAGGGSWMVKVGWLFVVLGLLAVCVGFLAINTYVVPNPNPGIRGQTFQMIQCIHFLWPPWLFGMLYRRMRTSARNALEVMISNSPYL